MNTGDPAPPDDGDSPSTVRPSRRTVLAAAGALGTVSVAACSTDSLAGALPSAAGPPRKPPAKSSSSPLPPKRSSPSGTSSAGAAGGSTRDAQLENSGPDIQAGPRGSQLVALTFHGAGPAALTTTALEVARAHGARLTVFAVGQWLDANPDLGRAILTGGHDLGNHTWSHQPMRRLAAAQAAGEVSRGAASVAAVRGSAGLLFRPSGTPSSTARIRQAALASGYHRCISYDVDPQDYLDPGTAAVRDRTLAAVRGGSIVSLHLGHAGTVAALPAILAGLRARGLTAATVTELLA